MSLTRRTNVEAPQPAARFASLDVMRGVALLGMIIVHFHQRTRLAELAGDAYPGEWLVGWVVWIGIEAKAWALFALLFGAGFALLMRSTACRSEAVVPLYLRRLAVLAAFGVVLEALTGFKVLLEYAVWAVPLLFMRLLPAPRLLAVATLAAISFWLAYVAVGLMPPSSGGGAATTIAHPTTYAGLVLQRLARMPSQYMSWRFLGTAVSLSLFIVGFLAVRHGCVEAPHRHRRAIIAAGAFGLICWATHWLLLYRLPTTFVAEPFATSLRYGVGVIREQWLGITFASFMLLALGPQRTHPAGLALLRDAGRMPLSNYALQAIVIEALSSPFGFGIRLRPYGYVAAAVGLFIVLGLFSRWWLRRFERGPLEWVWRSAAARLPRREARSAVAEGAAPGARPVG